MLSDDLKSLSALLRDWVDPASGWLALEPTLALQVLEQVGAIHLQLRRIEHTIVPFGAGSGLPEGVVDLETARRRRRQAWTVITGGSAA